MSQGDVDIGVFQEKFFRGVIFLRESSRYIVAATAAPSLHIDGNPVLYREA